MASNITFTSAGEIKTQGGWNSTTAPTRIYTASGSLYWDQPTGSGSTTAQSYNAGLALLGRANSWSNTNTFKAGGTVDASSSVGAITITNSGLVAGSGIKGSRVYNAVWNDLADSIPVDNDCILVPGKCYCYKDKKYVWSSKYLDEGLLGIHSDTYGMLMGGGKALRELYIAVAGFVLAYVDKEYEPGTPLTCTTEGNLTEINLEDKIKYPERIVATFWKTEPEKLWGQEGHEVLVNGRMWVKVR